jgi:hypothetical protein
VDRSALQILRRLRQPSRDRCVSPAPVRVVHDRLCETAVANVNRWRVPAGAEIVVAIDLRYPIMGRIARAIAAAPGVTGRAMVGHLTDRLRALILR